MPSLRCAKRLFFIVQYVCMQMQEEAPSFFPAYRRDLAPIFVQPAQIQDLPYDLLQQDDRGWTFPSTFAEFCRRTAKKK